jgi:dihydroneopterin aldolase
MTTSAALARDLEEAAKDRATGFVGERRTRIEGLVLLCRIGIHAQERLAPQRVRIDVELVAGEEPKGVPDDINAVICYERLVERIRQIAQAEHINLVETLAARIADHCCASLDISCVRVGVRKLDALADVEAVGVELERVAVRRRTPERVLRPS